MRRDPGLEELKCSCICIKTLRVVVSIRKGPYSGREMEQQSWALPSTQTPGIEPLGTWFSTAGQGDANTTAWGLRQTRQLKLSLVGLCERGTW